MTPNSRILPSLLCAFLLLSTGFVARAQGPSPTGLKDDMYGFLALSAELRLEGIKSDKPDWNAIRETVRKMRKNVEAMGSSSAGPAYHPYLEELAASLREIQTLSRREDKKISKAFDGLTSSCLQCHRTHLPQYRFQEPPP